jgi:large subunit ribosomal protein L1
MGNNGKQYRKSAEEAPESPVDLGAAIEFFKSQTTAKFDETMELAVRLGIDPKRSELAVRGVAHLPHGSGKNVRVLVFATGQAAEAARQAGAEHVGMDDMIEKVKGGWTDFDVAVATPEAMQEVRKLGRVLGPRGLMPNPKTGTVTDDTGKAVEQSKAGKVDFRMDRHGNVHVPFGKKSFEKDQLVENAEAVLSAIRAERPAAAKGTYIKSCAVSSTMGVGLRILTGN